MTDSPTTTTVDVAIIGYGPVGVTAATLLAQAGLRVLAVDRDADLYARARAISTDEEVIRIWQRIGLAERLKSDMLAGRAIDFVDTRGRSFMSFDPASRGNGHPTQLFIYQPALERVLREGAERYPGLQVRLGQECIDRQQDADGVTLTVRDVADGTVSTVRAAYVIAADGGSSATRTQLGIGFDGRTYEDRWVVIDTRVLRPWPDVDRLRFHCNPTRPAVDCPTPLGHHRWEFPVLPGDDEAELVSEPAIRRLLAAQGIGDEHVEVLRAVVYSHHVRFASRWRDGRIFLAGDAAHVMPPWIGEGMASGIRDAANLSWKLVDVIQGRLDERALDSYEPERKPHVRALTRLAVRFGRIITERNRTLARLRDPVIRTAMRVPALGDYVRSGAWFPDSYLATGLLDAGRGTRRGAVGWTLPQPIVLAGDGEQRLLDDALPPGWTVLTLDGSHPAGLDAWTDAGATAVAVRGGWQAPVPWAVVDLSGVIRRWFAQHHAEAVVLRPDGVVFGQARRGTALPVPPLRRVPTTTVAIHPTSAARSTEAAA